MLNYLIDIPTDRRNGT